jgi:hypothetical protein
VRRREFITLLGGVAAWPIGAPAQQEAKIPRIGILDEPDYNHPTIKTGASRADQVLTLQSLHAPARVIEFGAK